MGTDNGQDGWIRAEHLPGEIRFGTRPATSSATPFLLPEEGIHLEDVEKSFILQALERSDWNQTAAARLLGITRYTLRYGMEKFALKPPRR